MSAIPGVYKSTEGFPLTVIELGTSPDDCFPCRTAEFGSTLCWIWHTDEQNALVKSVMNNISRSQASLIALKIDHCAGVMISEAGDSCVNATWHYLDLTSVELNSWKQAMRRRLRFE